MPLLRILRRISRNTHLVPNHDAAERSRAELMSVELLPCFEVRIGVSE